MFWLLLILMGIFISRKYAWYARFNMAVLLSTGISDIAFQCCPLVLLENSLRAKYDPAATFEGSFICHYMEKYLGYRISPEAITLTLIVIFIFSALIFLRLPKKQSLI
jgi:hypothetical protein